MRFIIEALGLLPEEVSYVAYTGKAAQVLRQKGCPNAQTAHKLLYRARRLKNGQFRFYPRRTQDIGPYKLIVVDEVSMLPKDMWELLLSHKIPVIALGDPFQLPPVKGDNAQISPNIFLEEIMRQAQESEIIRLTMDIRAQKSLQLFAGKEVRVVNQSELSQPGIWTWADQILVGKNNTRHVINETLHKALLNTNDLDPCVGDKIICLRNNWLCINDTEDALVNGLGGIISKLTYTNDNPWMDKTPIIDFTPDTEDNSPFYSLMADYKIFTEHEPTVNEKNFKRIPDILQPDEFDYGYAITVHRSQGSQYPKVLVLEEHLRGYDKTNHARLLYTACTRASEKLILVKDYH